MDNELQAALDDFFITMSALSAKLKEMDVKIEHLSAGMREANKNIRKLIETI